MSQHLKTTLPIFQDELKPSVVNFQNFKEKDEGIKQREKRNFDSCHSPKELPTLEAGNQVWIPDLKVKGIVQKEAATRRYYVNTEKGTEVKRNRKHLNNRPEKGEAAEDDITTEQSNEDTKLQGEPVISKSGRVIKTPKRFIDHYWLCEQMFWSFHVFHANYYYVSENPKGDVMLVPCVH